MVASCHVKDALSAMTMLFSFLEIKKKLKQAGNNWWLLKYKNEADKNAGVKEIGYMEEYQVSTETKKYIQEKKELWIPVFVLMIGLVVLVNIGIRADSSQRDLIRSRAELNAVTYADHMKADIVRGIDITNLAKPLDIEKMKNTIKVICP